MFHRSRGRLIFLVGNALDDLERVVGQWPLQTFGLTRCRLVFLAGAAHEKYPAVLDGVKSGRKRR
jgi:hypothetical protein